MFTHYYYAQELIVKHAYVVMPLVKWRRPLSEEDSEAVGIEAVHFVSKCMTELQAKIQLPFFM